MCVNASAAAVAWACEAKHEMLSMTFWDHMKMRTNKQTQGKRASKHEGRETIERDSQTKDHQRKGKLT